MICGTDSWSGDQDKPKPGVPVLHVVGIESAKAERQEAMLYSEAGEGCSLEYEGEQ